MSAPTLRIWSPRRQSGRVEFGVELLLDLGQAPGEGERVGLAQPVVQDPLRVDADAVAGRVGDLGDAGAAGIAAAGVAAADLDRVRRAVAQADDDRPQPVHGFVRRRQRDGDGVEHAGVPQPLFELGHLGRIVDGALLPGRQAGDPLALGAALAHHFQSVEMHERPGREVKRRLHRMVRVVDQHQPRVDRGVGIAALAQRRLDAALGGQHVGRAPRRSWRQRQHLLGGRLRLAVRRQAVPVQFGLGQHRPWSWRHPHHRRRRVALADIGFDRIVVVALRPQHGDGRLAGFPRPPARVDPALRLRLGNPDRTLDLGLQRAIHLALHQRLWLRRGGDDRRQRDEADRRGGKDRDRSLSHASTF